jgi:hypothetical protein
MPYRKRISVERVREAFYYDDGVLVWLYHIGAQPEGDLDHIDRNPCNDRIENLRDVSHSVNLLNCRLHKNNTSGFRGVWFDKRRKKWIAESRKTGTGYIGQFETPEEAAAALEKALGHIAE